MFFVYLCRKVASYIGLRVAIEESESSKNTACSGLDTSQHQHKTPSNTDVNNLRLRSSNIANSTNISHITSITEALPQQHLVLSHQETSTQPSECDIFPPPPKQQIYAKSNTAAAFISNSSNQSSDDRDSHDLPDSSTTSTSRISIDVKSVIIGSAATVHEPTFLASFDDLPSTFSQGQLDPPLNSNLRADDILPVSDESSSSNSTSPSCVNYNLQLDQIEDCCIENSRTYTSMVC